MNCLFYVRTIINQRIFKNKTPTRKKFFGERKGSWSKELGVRSLGDTTARHPEKLTQSTQSFKNFFAFFAFFVVKYFFGGLTSAIQKGFRLRRRFSRDAGQGGVKPPHSPRKRSSQLFPNSSPSVSGTARFPSGRRGCGLRGTGRGTRRPVRPFPVPSPTGNSFAVCRE